MRDGDDDDDDQHRRSNLSRNAETFLTEIGVAFHGLHLDHLRKYTVSAAGGIMLTKDLALYQDAIGTLASLSYRIASRCFVSSVTCSSCRRRCSSRTCAKATWPRSTSVCYRPYLLRRADYAKEVRDLDEGPVATTPTTTRGIRLVRVVICFATATGARICSASAGVDSRHTRKSGWSATTRRGRERLERRQRK